MPRRAYVAFRLAGAAGRKRGDHDNVRAGPGGPSESNPQGLEQLWLLTHQAGRNVVNLHLEAEAVEVSHRVENDRDKRIGHGVEREANADHAVTVSLLRVLPYCAGGRTRTNKKRAGNHAGRVTACS